MIERNGSLYIFGGLLDENSETNEFWKFDIAGNNWERIHDFHKIDDPIETDSPSTALKARGKKGGKTLNLRSTMVMSSSFSTKKTASPAVKNSTLGKTTSTSMAKSSSMKTIPKKTKLKKEWELPYKFEEKKEIKVENAPEIGRASCRERVYVLV